VVGIDVSRRMMLKARQKGVQNLILADAHRMPFKDQSFDASIIIHVLHLIPDWFNVVREMGRVTKSMVAALLRNRKSELSSAPGSTGDSSAATPVFQELWTRYAELREEMGYPIKRNRRMWQNEEEIRSQLPPMKVVKISDEVVVTSVNDMIARFRQRAYPMLQDIPSDVQDKIIHTLLSSTATANNGKETAPVLQEKQVERRIIEELAIWRPYQLRPP